MQRESKEKPPEKLHVEIALGNWKKMEKYMKTYNDSPERITPRIKPADVINEALARFLKLPKEPLNRGTGNG